MWVDTCDLFLPLLLPLYDVNEVLQLSFQIYVLILAPNTRSSTGFLIKSLLKVWRLPADQNLSKCGKDVFLFFLRTMDLCVAVYRWPVFSSCDVFMAFSI